MTDPAERAAWVALALTPGLSRPRLLALLAATGSAQAALGTPVAALARIPGISPAAATAVAAASDAAGAGIIAATERRGGAVLIPGDPQYPAALSTIADPPAVLFALGHLDILDQPALAVVGSRAHTPYGAEVARRVSEVAARAGITVVSGMARGLDAVAHAAALDAGGRSIGVLGNGLGVVYPAANRALYDRMAASGLLLTEFPPGERPSVWTFPRRNRIISGLARATVVVEAAPGSGALITAEAALEQGREVLAVPGPITSPTSGGTNGLIRDGATPLLAVEEMLVPFGIRVSGGTAPAAPPAAAPVPPDAVGEPGRRILAALGSEPVLVDDLASATGLGVPALLAELCGLELLGLASAAPGNRYRRGH